jgi:hypothetical protein
MDKRVPSKVRVGYLYQQTAENPGDKPGGECRNDESYLDFFSFVPRLPPVL